MGLAVLASLFSTGLALAEMLLDGMVGKRPSYSQYCI